MFIYTMVIYISISPSFDRAPYDATVAQCNEGVGTIHAFLLFSFTKYSFLSSISLSLIKLFHDLVINRSTRLDQFTIRAISSKARRRKYYLLASCTIDALFVHPPPPPHASSPSQTWFYALNARRFRSFIPVHLLFSFEQHLCPRSLSK